MDPPSEVAAAAVASTRRTEEPGLEQHSGSHYALVRRPDEQRFAQRTGTGYALVRSTDGIEAARRSMCAQIARLERELAVLVVDAFGRASADLCPAMRTRAAGARSARLLEMAELERVRDALVAAVSDARASLERRAEQQRGAALLLERMRRDPASYRGVRVTAAELGVGGCGVWEVRPRLGLIGMLAGWWEVKLSSGCP